VTDPERESHHRPDRRTGEDEAMTAPADLLETRRTTVRRGAARASFDRALAYAVLDEALVAHVGVVVDDAPRVLPMTYGRIDDHLYLHGAVGNALLRAGDGVDVCVTVTLLDGLVLARSAFHHSMNYRCVVLYGTATRVDDPDEKRAAFDAIVDQSLPGRSAEARPASPAEVRATLVLRLPITEGSVKVRAHGVVDDAEDLDLPVWAGVVPLSLTPGTPVQDPDQATTTPGRAQQAPAAARLAR
jgi:nitroimidazol reductase NimA-like FMN-containing flavoprotein (pyridoxamine 5'-phosphate oxidase superfamily)